MLMAPLKQNFVCSSIFIDDFLLQSKINLSIQAEKIRDGTIQKHTRTDIKQKGKMDPKTIVDVLIFLPLVASDVKQLADNQLPKSKRKKDMTKARPFFGHFKSLVIVKYGTEGRACARRRGTSGHVMKLIKLNPNIEILSMMFEFAIISVQDSVMSWNKITPLK